MMNITLITYVVVLYFGSSAHRYVVDAANVADALEAALVEYSETRADQPHAVLRLRDFTVAEK
jgi:hypothetical protein